MADNLHRDQERVRTWYDFDTLREFTTRGNMPTLTTPPGAPGSVAPPFDLPGTDGRRHTLSSIRGTHGTVVMFICNHCPYVKAVVDKIVRDMRDLSPHGVGSVAIMSNDPADYPDDSFDNMMALAAKLAFPFPYLFDETQEVAQAYGAACTPDFFGYDRDLRLVYRGRLDGSGRSPDPAAPRELFTAMVDVARTGRAPALQHASVGCSIKWKRS
jgi:peroxiredoxin